MLEKRYYKFAAASGNILYPQNIEMLEMIRFEAKFLAAWAVCFYTLTFSS